MGECVRLARSGSRQNEEGTIVISLGRADAMLHGEPLLPIELLKIGGRHRANQIDWGDKATEHVAPLSTTVSAAQGQGLRLSAQASRRLTRRTLVRKIMCF